MNAPAWREIEVPLGTGHYEADSLPFSAQSCINLYPNIPEGPALSQSALYMTPGIDLKVTAAADKSIRNAHPFNDEIVLWSTFIIYRLDKSAAGTYTATFTSGLGDAHESSILSAANNTDYYMAISRVSTTDIKGIYIDTAWTATVITDVDFTTTNGVPQRVVFLDGYFVVTTDTDKFKISALNDPTTWNALDFSSAEADPDGIVAPFVFDNQLIIFGTRTFEVFQNIGGSGFPFVRIPGAVYDVGLSAEEAVIRGTNGFYYLGASKNELPGVWRSTGSKPQRVSSVGIDTAIQTKTEAEIALSFANAYSADGHYFVAFTIGDETFVYDEVTNRWGVRQSFSGDTAKAWRVRTVFPGFGDILAGDNDSGKIGILSDDTYAEFGEVIHREFVSPPIIGNQMRPFSLPMIELTIESGVGNDDIEDPQIEMSLSRDGKTWSSFRARSMGKIGEYNKRQIWRENGRFERFAMLKFRVTHPVNVRILKLVAYAY